MRRLYVATTRLDAYLLRDLLQHFGIDARVLNEHAAGGLGEIPFDAAQPQVWIDDEADFARARAVAREFSARRTTTGSWQCRHCGDENPDTFELCWKCGAGQN